MRFVTVLLFCFAALQGDEIIPTRAFFQNVMVDRIIERDRHVVHML